jgi:hypothetical protein
MWVFNNWKGVMDYATLGNTGLLVSKLCFGTMTFGDGRGIFKAISSVGQAGADELVKLFFECSPSPDPEFFGPAPTFRWVAMYGRSNTMIII